MCYKRFVYPFFCYNCYKCNTLFLYDSRVAYTSTLTLRERAPTAPKYSVMKRTQAVMTKTTKQSVLTGFFYNKRPRDEEGDGNPVPTPPPPSEGLSPPQPSISNYRASPRQAIGLSSLVSSEVRHSVIFHHSFSH